MRKFIMMGMLLIISIFLLACESEKKEEARFDTGTVLVLVKYNYREKFDAKEFTVEDFDWTNIEKIAYRSWNDKADCGSLTIYLKKHGEKQVLDAVKHFNTLDFVKIAEPNFLTHLD